MSWETRNWLNQRAAAYAEAQPPVDDGGKLPDGMYQAEIVGCAVLPSKTTGEPYLSWELRIVSGNYVGRTIRRFNQIRTEQNLMYLKKDLASAGMQLASLPELPEAAQDLVGRILDVKLVTKGDYQNCYIQGLVCPNNPGAVSDDDVPASWR
jgi:hypothetical protein